MNLKLLMLLCLVVSLTACASVDKIGTIHGYDVHEVSTSSAFAPNTTTIVLSKEDMKPEVINKGAGASVAGTVAMPLANVASSVIEARAIEEAARRLRPDETNIENHGSQAAAGAAAKGGDAVAEGGKAFSASKSEGGKAYSSSDSYANSRSSSKSRSSSYSEAEADADSYNKNYNVNLNKNKAYGGDGGQAVSGSFNKVY